MSEPCSSMQRSGRTTKTTLRSERRSTLKKYLTGPTLLEISVVRGGIGFTKRLRCSKHRVVTGKWILTLEPERRKEPKTVTRDESCAGRPEPGAQAACGFKYLASKHAPFFHTSRVIAAILRATVSRAMCGFAPRATQASYTFLKGPLLLASHAGG